MASLSSEIQGLLKNILQSRKDIAYLVCQQRVKFEGWLKIELASALKHKAGFEKITLEDSYATNGRSDISFESGGDKWYIEMKTANTNWRAENLENLTRPITRNIDGIVEDITVLREKSTPAHGVAVFCIFPVPVRLWKNTREQLNYHLRRIEEAGKLPRNTLLDNVEFVETTTDFGICTFAVEIS
jgi:hypothetical protein